MIQHPNSLTKKAKANRNLRLAFAFWAARADSFRQGNRSIAHCKLLIAHCPLPIVYCPSSIAHCLLFKINKIIINRNRTVFT